MSPNTQSFDSRIYVPTDNLYKFTAIFSAILVPTLIVSMFSLFALFSDEGDNTGVLLGAAMEGRVYLLTEDGPQQSFQPPPPPAIQPKSRPSDSDARMAPVPPQPLPDPDFDWSDPSYYTNDAKLGIPDEPLIWFARIFNTMLYLVVLLLFATMLGFVLWYTRLQRYRDRLIRTETLTAELTYQMIVDGKILPNPKPPKLTEDGATKSPKEES